MNKLHTWNNSIASIEITPDEYREFYPLPTSPAVDAMYRAMGAGADIETLGKGTSYNHNRHITTEIKDNKALVTSATDNSTVTLQLGDLDLLKGSNKGAKKILVHSLIQINEQAYSAGVLKRDYIEYPLQELIDIGAYKTPQSARKGFNNATEVMTSFKVKGELKKGKKSAEVSAIEVLFTGGRIERGMCKLFINERIDWGFITAFYTLLPKSYFSLSNRASDLLYYVFYLARQNIRQIKNEGGFNISLKAVQSMLRLPSEAETKNPDRDIRQAILDAIKEIQSQCTDEGFILKVIANTNGSIGEYLEGYLRVELQGDYKEYYLEQSARVERQLQEAERKRAQLEANVQAKLIEKARSKDKSIQELDDTRS